MTLTNQNIEQLLELCKSNDQRAQMEVYNRYYKVMYNTSYRIVKDSYKAEDIMQESFLSAFTKLGTLKEISMFGAWLKRIVINKSIDLLKSKKQQLQELEEVHLKVVDETNDEWLVEDNISIESVKQMIEQLPDKYKYVVILYLIEGYDYEELCEILNISYANCRTLISRAKDSLRKQLAL